MNKTLKKCRTIRILTMVACLAMLPTWLCGQNSGKEKTKSDNNDWTETKLKDAGKRLKDVIAWQAAIDNYEAEKTKLNSLVEESAERKKELEKLNGQLLEIQKILRTNCADSQKSGGFEELYKQYDTILLLQVQGRLGDERSEQIVSDLLACHRAEALLFVAYDADRVGKASEELKTMDNGGKAMFIRKLASRLDGYLKMTDILKGTLMEVDATCKCKKDDSFVIKDEVKAAFLERMGNLDPALFKPQDYPYLHGILVEALEMKDNDPSNDLQELIDKL